VGNRNKRSPPTRRFFISASRAKLNPKQNNRSFWHGCSVARILAFS